MGLPEYLEVLRRRWRSVLTICLLGAVVAVGASLLGTTRSASTTLILDTGHVDGGVSGSELAAERLTSYAELATGPRVTASVAGDLGVPDDAALARDLSVQASPESLLLVLTAEDPAPDVALAKATSASTQLIGLVDEVSPGGPRLTVAQPAALVPPAGLPEALSTALLGAVLGLAAGIAVALLRDGADRRVRVAPTLPGPGGATPLVLAELPVGEDQLRRHAAAMPREGPVAEGFRRLRTSLLAGGADQRTVIVTSARSGEGGAEVARGLAVVLARGGLRVALVDAHVRGEAPLPDAAGGPVPRGLASVLRGECVVEEALVHGGEPGLAVLPGGGAGPDAGELLTSGAMAKLVAALHDSADVVVLDVPAVLPFADAAALTAAVGGEAVLVVRSGATRERDAGAALAELLRVRPSSLGVVVLADPARQREPLR